MKINFDKKTYLPNNIEFKKLNQSINMKIEIVRYPTQSSDSGAYIFGPRYKAVPLNLQIIDAKILDEEDKFLSKIIIFYKSQYSKNCIAIITITLYNIGNK